MFCDDPLTEDGWQGCRTCDDAAWMIRRVWLDTGHPSARKSQLFVCACARHIWHLLADERSRSGVEAAEQHLGGLASRSAVEAAAEAAAAVCRETERGSPQYWPSVVAGIAARPSNDRFNDWKAPNALRRLCLDKPESPAAFVRDIFGNPFRPISFDPTCRTATVLSLAQAAYAERALPSGELEPARLNVLADALEDGGCTDEAILAHLRSPGPHVRGCWALDLILGKG